MTKTAERVGAWSGIATILTFGLSFWPFADFLPPVSPTFTAAQVASFYQQHCTGIRVGMVLMLFAGSLNSVFVGAIAVQLKRIEKANTVWSYTQIVSGGCSSAIITCGAMLMTAVAFRPDRPPEETYALFDLAWLMVVMPGTPIIIQTVAIGLAILSDKNPTPIFPRWFGYFNVWAALVYMPGFFCTFFKTGPLAWDGLFAFWLPAIVFGLWFPIMVTLMLRTIARKP